MSSRLLPRILFCLAFLVTLSVGFNIFNIKPAFGVTFKATPLIVDDDGSQDGMTALAFMLENPKFNVKAITIAQGLAHPQIFGNNVTRMLTRLEKTGISVGIGSDVPLAGNNAFPDAFRESTDTFWAPFVTLPEKALQTVDNRDAASLIIDTVKQSQDPVSILATGPLTNIAEALRRDPTIAKNIAAIEIMGGAVFVPGNLREHLDPVLKQNQVSEFNIWVDPVAAQEVFSAGLPIFLTPLDATNKIGFTRADLEAWKATGTPESVIASELLNFALTVISGNDPLIPNPAWDLVAAINLSEPSFCEKTPLHIEVNTNGKPEVNQGQTVAIPGLPPNANVCFNPSFANFKFS
ncbi:MAG: nucleoside hydrolase [Scytonema sp. RU_4_4]|nr:nucleoside hydrolase [Scytonema sp. RU_4_4]